MANLGRRELLASGLAIVLGGAVIADTAYNNGFRAGSKESKVVIVSPPPPPIERISTLFVASEVSNTLDRKIGLLASADEQLLAKEFCSTLAKGEFPILKNYEMVGLDRNERPDKGLYLPENQLAMFRLKEPWFADGIILSVYSGDWLSSDTWVPLPRDQISVVNTIALDVPHKTRKPDEVVVAFRSEEPPEMLATLPFKGRKHFSLVSFNTSGEILEPMSSLSLTR